MASSPSLRVLAVVPSIYDTAPGQRFRMEQWAPRLAEHGIEVEFAPFEDARLHDVLYRAGHVAGKAAGIAAAFGRRLALLSRARAFDVVYVFREAALLGPAFVEWRLARSGVPVVFDFDDAIFERYVSPANGYLSLLKSPGKTASICRMATHVMAGNPYLAEYAGRYNDRVTIVPTTIDTSRYRASGRPAGRPLVVGWSGSHSTVMHLRTIEGALRRLAATHPFRLRVIGEHRYGLDGVPVDALPWRAETEVQDLDPIDVGVMPLPDDRWSRGKCALKALQYMALGIPTICSPVGVNAQIIRHGENGLIASSEDEWVAALQALLESDATRAAMGAAGRETVERTYSADAQVPVVRDVLVSAARTRHPAAARLSFS